MVAVSKSSLMLGVRFRAQAGFSLVRLIVMNIQEEFSQIWDIWSGVNACDSFWLVYGMSEHLFTKFYHHPFEGNVT